MFSSYMAVLRVRFLEDELPCSAMCQNIRAILEELRIRMHMDMTEELGIPALDPMEIDRLHLNLQDFELGEYML